MTFLPYNDKDRKLFYVLYVVGIIFAVLFSIWTIAFSSMGFVFSVFIAFLGSVLIILGFISYSLKKTNKKLTNAIQKAILNLDGTALRSELNEMNEFLNAHPKNKYFYAPARFSMTRLIDPEAAEEYIKSLKLVAKHKRANEMLKANITMELCFYYLQRNEIELFLLGVKKMKSYHYTVYEKLVRKLKKSTPNINELEWKELALLGKFYTTAPTQEEIDKLLSSEFLYYRMIYTYFIMKYYESKNDSDKANEYQSMLNEYSGNVFPLVEEFAYEV